MTESLRILLEGVIDYAGLFPPAKLEMGPAVEEYLDHIEGPEEFMVNRFICPVGRLGELAAATPEDVEFEVTVIGADSLADDVKAVTEFEAAVGERMIVTAYEVKPPDVADMALALAKQERFEAFVEVPLDGDLSANLAAIAAAVGVGAKARTGGLEAAAFPSPAQLAQFLKEAMDLELTFKLTAGLHHPFRTNDQAVGATMHGFLNVLSACALIEEHDLSRREIEEVLSERNPRLFVFDDEGLEFDGNRASMASCEQARLAFVGFGSCSIADPVRDLRSLGLA